MNHTTTSSSTLRASELQQMAALGTDPNEIEIDVCNDVSPSCYPNDGNESGLVGDLEWSHESTSATAAFGGDEDEGGFDGEVCNDISPSCYPNDGNESGLAGDLGGDAAPVGAFATAR